MTNNPNYTIKITSTPIQTTKTRQKTHSVTPNISKLHNSALESRQKSIEQIKSENIQNPNISTHITTTILYYTTKTYNKLATNRK